MNSSTHQSFEQSSFPIIRDDVRENMKRLSHEIRRAFINNAGAAPSLCVDNGTKFQRYFSPIVTSHPSHITSSSLPRFNPTIIEMPLYEITADQHDLRSGQTN